MIYDKHDDGLRNCPQCGEDMLAGDELCRTCARQKMIDDTPIGPPGDCAYCGKAFSAVGTDESFNFYCQACKDAGKPDL